MNPPNQFHNSFVAFIFSISCLLVSYFYAFVLFIGFPLFCINMEASNLDINFLFQYNTSKLEASIASSSMVFDYHTLKQTTQI